MTNPIKGIYAITPNQPFSINAVDRVLSRGVRILQYRHKTNNAQLKLTQAKQLKLLCQQHQALFIINDDITLCQQVDADGVHLGLDDMPLTQARQQLGDDKIIGISCYNKIDLAQQAQSLGADYVAFGAIFPSSTKPHAPHCPLSIITQAKTSITIPIVGIGGVTMDNKQQAYEAGCDSVAMISGLFTSSFGVSLRYACKIIGHLDKK